MNAISKAIKRAGGPSKVAAVIGVSTQAVCFYRDAKRRMPVEYCAVLSKKSGVARWLLRPDDWHVIWPELVGTEGAPPVPEDHEVHDAA